MPTRLSVVSLPFQAATASSSRTREITLASSRVPRTPPWKSTANLFASIVVACAFLPGTADFPGLIVLLTNPVNTYRTQLDKVRKFFG